MNTTESPHALTGPDLRLESPDDVDVRETHISWVFLAGDRAFKVKKPLLLPYLDYRTPAQRLAMCRDEVRLNRRLAPDVYVGVRSLVPRAGGGLTLSDADDPAAVDHAVEMRRFDDADTLAARLSRGAAGTEDIARVGRRLAHFHADAQVQRRANGAELVKRALDDTFASLRSQVAAARRPWMAAHERMAAAVLTSLWEPLDARGGAGCIRDGHGDLRLEHVVLEDGGLAIVDCVEFSRELRCIDVAADLAFLVMELHRTGHRELAAVLVAAYRDAGGHPGSDRLLSLLAAYRAHVRAKVAFTRAGQGDGDAHGDARALLGLAARLLWRALTPSVIVVAGVSASGKSTVAERLAAESGFSLLATDALRKSRAGLATTARAPESLYADEVSQATYHALGREARAAARDGVIVDGTFRRRTDRAAFLAALGDVVTPLVVECRAPASVLLARAEARERDPRRVSDAGRRIVASQIGTFEPLDEIAARDHVVLRSDRAPGALVSEIGEAVARRAIASPAR